MPRLLATATAMLWLTWYLLSCWLWPFRRCWVCDGFGRHARTDRQVFRDCWWCKGSGRRLRFGRRLANHWRGRARDAA